MGRTWQTSIVGALGILAGGAAVAAEPEGTVVEAAGAAPSMIDAAVSLDWSNRYFSGGLLHGAEGILMQPGAELGLTPSPDLGLRLFAGAWGSVHQIPAEAAAATRSAWHEVDVMAGLEVEPVESLSVMLRYAAYLSPSMSFDHVHELGVKVAWDDAEAWGGALGHRFGGLQPELLVTFDAERTDLGTGAGAGAELMFEPSFELVRDAPVTLTLSVPLDVGLGLDGDGHGAASPLIDFAHAGVTLAFGLGFVPESAGAWTAKMTGRVLALGGRMAADNGGERVVALGSVGVGAEF